jgi:hypothetical protein
MAQQIISSHHFKSIPRKIVLASDNGFYDVYTVDPTDKVHLKRTFFDIDVAKTFYDREVGLDFDRNAPLR